MAQSTAQDVPVSVLDTAVDRARTALHRLCSPRGWLAPHLCGCGRASCRNDREETVSLAILLRATGTAWAPDEPEPAEAAHLRECLLALAQAFGLDDCPEGTPGCRCSALEEGDARAVLLAVADAWHGRSGNLVAPTPEKLRAMAESHAANVAALEVLARRLDPDLADTFRAALPPAGRLEGAWEAEARAMAAEAIATWIPEPTTLTQVGRVLDGALAVAFHGGWTSEEAVAFEGVMADACAGLLARGFAHESVTAALLAPLGAVVSPQDLYAAADAERMADAAA
jgi:uncharacterized protein (DUF2267 family)